jgi:hypothetical protein
MGEPSLHIVELELTREEWRLVRRLAELRHSSISDVLREAARLAPLEPARAIPTGRLSSR